MSSKKPQIANKSNSKFFISPNSNAFTQNVQSILTLNTLMPNRPNTLTDSQNVQMDTISESGFKFSNYKINLGSLYRRNPRKTRSNSININPINAADTTCRISGVMFYLSYSTGLCGNLLFTKKSILFELDQVLKESQLAVCKHNGDTNLRPDGFRNSHEIDFLNIGDVHAGLMKDHFDITIFCRDFRHFKISMKPSEKAEAIVDRIRTISFDNITQAFIRDTKVGLWEYLFHKYRFQYKTDWCQHEQWYAKNCKIRFSFFNEIGVCDTLPDVMMVPRNIKDNLLERLLSISIGHRIPVVTYLHRDSGNMIIRSTSFGDQTLQDIFVRNLKHPLRELNIDAIFNELNDIDKSYAKLRKYCFLVAKLNDSNITSFYEIDHSKQFWSKCNPWLYTLYKVLKHTTEFANIVRMEASIGLVETNDCKYNCVLASLVQLVLDPARRTIDGFESLLSKEWIYLFGYRSHSQHSSLAKSQSRLNRCPNAVMFVLFIDCVHQLIIQNPRCFEFTTFYLISLLDMQFATENYKREISASLEESRSQSLSLNPLYSTEATGELVIGAHITKMRFFASLYFRHIQSDILKYTPEEGLYRNELYRRRLI